MQLARTSTAVAITALSWWGGAACDVEPDAHHDVLVARVARGDDLESIRRAAAAQLLSSAEDDYDMLVLWDTRALGGPHFSYLPVANDVAGIGDSLYDRASDYGSERLEGIVWMGSQWRELSAADGRYSVFGILAQETAHRWAAMVNATSARTLASDGVHWSALADLGDSPIGGNRWRDVGDGTFVAEQKADATFSDADLYLMGLLPAESVAPIPVLVDVRAGACASPHPCTDAWHDVAPPEIEGTLTYVAVTDIVAAEGTRVPIIEPEPLRQAWVLVVYDDEEPRAADLAMLRELRDAWPGYWARATRELGGVDIGP